jgi:hypothetical protein
VSWVGRFVVFGFTKDGLLVAFALAERSVNVLVPSAGYFRPVAKRFCDAIYGQVRCVALISRILLIGGPTAVAFAVVSVHLNTVQFKPRLISGSHIVVKIKKIAAPLVGNADPSSAIVLVMLALFVVAPSQHPRPHLVQLGLTQSMGQLSLGASL